MSCALTLALAIAATAAADTASDVASANAHLKRAEANLELVANDTSAGKPAGSRARLAQMRLDQAKADITPAGEALKALPDDGEGVADARKRHAAAVALAAKLQAILDDKPAEEKKPEPPPADKPEEKKDEPKAEEKPAEPKEDMPKDDKPAAEEKKPDTTEEAPAEKKPETVRLGYQQEEQLKNARFHLREVEGNANALTKMHAEFKPLADQLTIDHREVTKATATIANAKRKAGFAADALKTLPDNGEGVAEVKATLERLNKEVAGAEAYFKPLNDQLQKLIDPAQYPQFKADNDRLGELAGMFHNETIFLTDRAQAAAIFAQLAPARAEAEKLVQTYARLIQQKTPEGVQIAGRASSLVNNQERFLANAAQQREALPGEIRATLADVDQQANNAVAEQKPLWFTGGIPQRMGEAEDRYALFAALDPEQAPALRKEIDAMQASLDKRAKSLEQLIIQQNPLPQNNFDGPDRDKAIAVAVDAWKHQQKDFSVLTARIPSQAWARETLWTYSNGTWYFVDRSKLQVQLILADPANAKQAMIIPINIIKDHQKGDTMIGVPLYAGDEKLQPGSYMLRDKVK